MNVPLFEPGGPSKEGKREVQSAETYPNRNTPALATLLGRQTMRDTEIGTPVTATDGDDAEFCDDDGGTDGGCDFLACFDAEADVAFGVADDDNGLEAGALSGAGLLLNGFDLCKAGPGCQLERPSATIFSHCMYVNELEVPVTPIICQPSQLNHSHTPHAKKDLAPTYLHNLILQLGQKEIHNLVFLDGQRMQINLLHALDLARFH